MTSPGYKSYNGELLQDALARINRERFPLNFAALQGEIERRARMNRRHSKLDRFPILLRPRYEVVALCFVVGWAAGSLV